MSKNFQDDTTETSQKYPLKGQIRAILNIQIKDFINYKGRKH